jgi:hypothetical protein
MTPDKVAELVASLDAYILQRRRRKLDEWLAAIEQGDDEALYALCRQLVEIQLPDLPDESDDPDKPSPAEQADDIIQIARRLLLRPKALADAAAGIKPSFANRVRVRSMAKILADVKPRADPGAPRQERSGRRRETALVEASGPPIDGVWQLGIVVSFHPRLWTGSIRGRDGIEYPLAGGCLARSGLVTLIVGQRCQFKAVGGEVDIVRAAWH